MFPLPYGFECELVVKSKASSFKTIFNTLTISQWYGSSRIIKAGSQKETGKPLGQVDHSFQSCSVSVDSAPVEDFSLLWLVSTPVLSHSNSHYPPTAHSSFVSKVLAPQHSSHLYIPKSPILHFPFLLRFMFILSIQQKFKKRSERVLIIFLLSSCLVSMV